MQKNNTNFIQKAEKISSHLKIDSVLFIQLLAHNLKLWNDKKIIAKIQAEEILDMLNYPYRFNRETIKNIINEND